jgi:hypothetical protein
MLQSLLMAQGIYDRGPANTFPEGTFPRIFLVNLTTRPNINMSTKPRAMYIVKSAKILTFKEFLDPSHSDYHMAHPACMEDYERQKRIRQQMMPSDLPVFQTMVVQKLYYHNGSSAFMYHKNWYATLDARENYSNQWRPDGSWLEYLKETVKAGNGWERDDVHF